MVPSYLYQAPTGVPGDITRTDESNVEPAMLVVQGSDYPKVGMGVKYATGGVQVPSGDAATTFAGVMVREVPGISNSSADDASFSPQTPWIKQAQGLLVRGYCTVLCAAGTPARGGVVYWQVTDNGGVKAGSFRADGTDSGNAVALTATQAEWATDGVDADLNAEIRVAR
jgi:hypothetical protein